MVSTATAALEEAYLRLLDPAPVRAQEKYDELFRRLERFFEWRRCESPEDLAQETIFRVLNKVARGELAINAGDTTPLFYGFAKNLLLESRRAAARNRTEELTELVAPETEGAGSAESRILVAQCLKALSPRERRLLIAYYAGDRNDLRRDLNLSDGALRVAVLRVKEKARRSAGWPVARPRS